MIELSTRRFIELSPGPPRLHRAIDDHAPSVLVAGRGVAAPSAVAALQREYVLRSALHERWSAVPQAIVSHGGGAVLILADPGGMPLTVGAAPQQRLSAFLRRAISLATALGEMHAAGIVHRALAPHRFLVDDDDRAFLTGFGYAIGPDATDPLRDTGLEWEDTDFVYTAPELGTRMNLRVDARADLYSLGCILYEQLTGVPPFDATDAAGLVHAHATHSARAPHALVPHVPEQISRIVVKLLEKAPEQRYGTAAGLVADLQRCEQCLRRDGRIPMFALDVHAALQRLQQADHVVGREQEIDALRAQYRAVAAGGEMRVAWVSGHSGIGKSTLLLEAVARIRHDGALLVATSKGEEGRRGTPYAMLAQALEPLLQFVLGCADDEFDMWRARIGTAVAPVGRTLARFLPALSAVLGPQAGPPEQSELAPGLERERVLQAIARLIACFAAPERPLALLLDDLQWADAGTIQVLERLVQQHRDTALLLVGAYRGNEIDASHPLRAGPLADVPDALTVELGPLNERATTELIAHALHQDTDALRPLSDLIGQRTGRNPFFVHHLLRLLADEGMLDYDAGAGLWRWNMARIAAHRGGDDVAMMLARQFELLPDAARFMLRLLACIGQRASTRLLASAAGLSEPDAIEGLQAALDAGSLQRDGGDWTFWHDRIREAAYASIPEDERAPLHHAIACRLLAAGDACADTFVLAAQANLAGAVVETPAQRRAFARVNLEAGQQARAATAHHSALGFFRAAVDFLGERDTTDDGLQARMLCAEAEFMTGALEAAEARLAELERVAGDGTFGADLTRLRAALYTALGRFDLALGVGLAFLKRAGIDIPPHPDSADVHREYLRLRGWLDRNGIDALRDLPIIADPLQRAIVDIFADLIPPALYSDQDLVDMILLRAVNLAIEHGHSDASADVYVCMNQIFGVRYGDYVASLAFGELALHLVDERGLDRYRGRVYMAHGTIVVPWVLPARSARAYISRAFEITVECCDHTFALYCKRNEATGMLFAGEFLGDVRDTVTHGLAIARDANFQLVIDALLAQQMLLRRLQEGECDDRDVLAPPEGRPPTLVDLAYWVYRLQAALLFGDLPDALDARRHAEACEHAARSFAERADLPFYGALALLALPGRDASDEAALQRHVEQLDVWARACPENFVARRELVRAEHARVSGQPLDAAEAYARAVTHAGRHGFAQVEALAAEYAARFHAGRDTIAAHAYLRHAQSAWQRWGALAKVRQLQAAHPDVFDAGAGNPVGSRMHALDVNAVLRVSNALASDIVPARLVETLLRTTLESAGAEHGALAVLREGVWHVPARADVIDGTIVVTQEAVSLTASVLPVSVVQAVARTQEGVVIDDASESPVHGQDAYVRRRRPRSVMCVPLMRYATLVGVLYMENNLAARMFTAAKAALVEVIASQAAFALENARLYEELVEQNRQRAHAEEQLRAALAGLERASRLTAMGELVASIVHEIGQPIAAVDTSASAGLRWLNREPPDVGEAREMLAHINRSAARAKSIIQTLRAKARKAAPQFATVDLAEAVREAAALVARQLDTLDVVLELRSHEGPVYVYGDRIQLQQVVINLLTNGAESMAELETARRLSLACEAHGVDSVCVSVEDSGSGIAPDIADRLLEPLFTTKENGMGMGLAISHSIVDAHGGTLTLSPREGAGTRATVMLPRVDP
ncbi:AAA family ATPase [Burkholderia sp. Tr-862]|uniref:trifunctional serine/threonine-protein kinase/ATP-binding protein/sensor histidine kinase n=1 Tax=Burkholderia sp. Tr-862 TaxID=2608331 RepID=UPI00141A00A7|nr:trifunctional serine/threonine-protein kinase/ATP-binding protein/sensor histidine kinase [Burkholderia sp. Tr-862]NIF40719.1 AAA family ATPase [Burkholderia sp. Tr-862]